MNLGPSESDSKSAIGANQAVDAASLNSSSVHNNDQEEVVFGASSFPINKLE